MYTANKKIVDALALRVFLDSLEAFRNTRLKIGYAAGVFDLLHPGHMHMLSEARKRCDFLFAFVSADEVAKNKGPDRPIHAQSMRALSVSHLASVDAVILGRSELDLKTNKHKTIAADIALIKPNIAFLGCDYNINNMPSHALETKCDIVFITGDLNCHTTQIITRTHRLTLAVT